ncbi:MAG: NAD(P)/FAD-dependent oxidoreductase [Mogibacterium sp.]|nr:NAD(P)/FAD-dependent oxidoreductase [Mogibacterium sp.]
MVFDTAIIGTGPAGLSAALNLKLHNKEVIWFGAKNFSSKVEKSEKIANYPGLGLIGGKELIEKFEAHRDEMGLEITEQMVTAIMPGDDYFMMSAGSDVYMAKTLLLATGVAAGKGFSGEAEFLGRGLSYCATCDGFLYKGKTIAVFCGDARFEHEVEYLAELADKVYLSTSYKDVSIDKPNVELLPKAIKSVSGGLKVNTIQLVDGTEITIDGLFCLRNSIAPTTLLNGLKLDGVHIVTGRDMATNIPGCFAAGDCTGRPYQIAKSVGEGNIAAHSIIEFLAEKEKK